MNALVTASTFSKDPSAWGFPSGTCVKDACGKYLILSDNRQYLDWVSGLGTNLLGYRVGPGATMHISPSLPHKLEYSVAEKLANLLGTHVPSWHPDELGVRWCKTGSEATTMAVRLARAVTGQYGIIRYGYNGWLDWAQTKDPSLGIVPFPNYLTFDVDFRYRPALWDAKQLFRKIGCGIACVILEQPATDPIELWYEDVKEFCEDNGALLIMDEVVTGLRYGLGGACERYNIEPDLVCMGKALGNGSPIAALVGRREYMNWFAAKDPVFCSSTTWGEVSSLQMADYVLDTWDQESVDYIWHIGNLLIEGLKEAGYDIFGHGARSVVRFKNNTERAVFIHGMRERGILMNRPNFPCLAHLENDVKLTVEAAKEIRFDGDTIKKVKDGMYGLPRVLFESR